MDKKYIYTDRLIQCYTERWRDTNRQTDEQIHERQRDNLVDRQMKIKPNKLRECVIVELGLNR